MDPIAAGPDLEVAREAREALEKSKEKMFVSGKRRRSEELRSKCQRRRETRREAQGRHHQVEEALATCGGTARQAPGAEARECRTGGRLSGGSCEGGSGSGSSGSGSLVALVVVVAQEAREVALWWLLWGQWLRKLKEVALWLLL